MTEESMNDETRYLLRHLLATIAYRGARSLADAPEGYAETRLADDGWTAGETLAHMTNVLGYVYAKLTDTERERHEAGAWAEDLESFYGMLRRLDDALAGEASVATDEALRFVQGPLADALTHVGQLAAMRRVAGAPVPAQNYILAKIEVGKVGFEENATD